MESKTCSTCGNSKPLTDFNVRRASPDGRGYRCHACLRAYRKARQADADFQVRNAAAAKAWREANPERERERKKRYYEANKEALMAQQREYREANADKVRARQAEYRRRNRERILRRKREYWRENRLRLIAQRKEWGRKNADYVRRQGRKWQKQNRDKCNLAQRRYARRHPSRIKAKSVASRRLREQAAGNCSTTQVLARVAYFGARCYLCGGAYEAVDHVKPIAAGGTHWSANLRPVCQTCNSRKAAAWPLSAVQDVMGGRVRHGVDVGVLP